MSKIKIGASRFSGSDENRIYRYDLRTGGLILASLFTIPLALLIIFVSGAANSSPLIVWLLIIVGCGLLFFATPLLKTKLVIDRERKTVSTSRIFGTGKREASLFSVHIFQTGEDEGTYSTTTRRNTPIFRMTEIYTRKNGKTGFNNYFHLSKSGSSLKKTKEDFICDLIDYAFYHKEADLAPSMEKQLKKMFTPDTDKDFFHLKIGQILLYHLDSPADAEKYLSESLRLLDFSKKKDQTKLILTANGLLDSAYLYLLKNEDSLREKMLQRSSATIDAIDGSHSFVKVFLRIKQGLILGFCGKHKEALVQYDIAIKDESQILGVREFSVYQFVSSFALKDYPAAEKSLKGSLPPEAMANEFIANHFKENDLLFLRPENLIILCDMYKALDRKDEAENLMKEAQSRYSPGTKGYSLVSEYRASPTGSSEPADEFLNRIMKEIQSDWKFTATDLNVFYNLSDVPKVI